MLYGKAWDQQLKGVKEELQILMKNKLKHKQDRGNTLFLGDLIAEPEVKSNPYEGNTMQDMQPPKDLPSLGNILGMTRFFSRFIPNYWKIEFPLYQLIKDGVEWEWTESCQKAFEISLNY